MLDKNLNKKAFTEAPVETFEDATEVPSEFVIKDPTNIPTRRWGDADASHLPLNHLDLQLPLIDMSPLAMTGADQDGRVDVDQEGAKKVVAEIGRACEEWGFFQAVNHGIPECLLDRLVEVAHEFFRLPPKEKLEYVGVPGQIEGYGRFDFNARDRFWNDCLLHNIRPKPLPEMDFMPGKPPSYKGLVEEYTQGLEKLLHILMTSLSEYLGLESATLLEKTQLEDASELSIRLNYYPKCPEPERVVGLGNHRDFGTITVLLQDEVGGLQVEKPGTDVWVDVKPMKGSLVINIATQLEMLSNGRFTSSTHRALVNRNKARVSIAAFAKPGPKCIIRPVQELLQKTGQLPRYKQVIYGDYAPNLMADREAGLRPEARYEINRN